jgi:hypothetical protein
MSQLRLSVVVPLPDHRGHAVEAIRSWTVEQTFPREEYEVVVIRDGREPEVEAEVAKLLRAHDRLVTLSDGSLHDCYNAGGRAARGELLLFTESHVKATPDCVSQIVERFEVGDVDAAPVASGGIDETRFAGQEQLIYEEALPGRIASGWNLFTVRGCAIKRAIFERAGGFLAEYGHFCELILGAQLRHLGARMKYAERAKVFHFNSGTIAHFGRELNAFGRDEIRFRADHPDSPLIEYFGPCPIWEQRRNFSREGAMRRCARSAAGMFQHLAGGKLKLAGRDIEEMIRFLPAAVIGSNWLRLRALLAVAWAVLLLYLLYPTRHGYYRAFCAMWNGQIRRGRALQVADWLGKEARLGARRNSNEAAAAWQRAA